MSQWATSLGCSGALNSCLSESPNQEPPAIAPFGNPQPSSYARSNTDRAQWLSIRDDSAAQIPAHGQAHQPALGAAFTSLKRDLKLLNGQRPLPEPLAPPDHLQC